MNNAFGSVGVQTNNSTVVIVGDKTLLSGISASSFNLTSGGSVADDIDSTISVSGLTLINAGTDGSITLGTDESQTVNLGSIDLAGTSVTLI